MAKNIFSESPVDTFTRDLKSKSYELPDLSEVRRKKPQAEPSAGSLDIDYTPDDLKAPEQFKPIFDEAATTYGVPGDILQALAQQESSYRPDAIGVETPWGRAKGIMQYIDPTAESLGINPFDPAQAIDAAAKQFAARLANGYSIEEAIMAHHGGDNREQWGPKTRQYAKDVMKKAGIIGYNPNAYEGDKPPGMIAREGAGYQPEAKKPRSAEERVEGYMRGTGIGDQQGPVTVAPGWSVTGKDAKGDDIGGQVQFKPGKKIEPKPENYDTFTQATKKELQNVPENFIGAIGGLTQLFGESMAEDREQGFAQGAARMGLTPEEFKLIYWAESNGLISDEMKAGQDIKMVAEQLKDELAAIPDERIQQFVVDSGLVNPERIAGFGEYVRSEQESQKEKVNAEPGSMAYYGSQTIRSIAENLPALAMSVATRNPTYALGDIGVRSAGTSYGEGRDKGLSPEKAREYATTMALAEIVPSTIPVSRFITPGKTILKDILGDTVTEGAQEAITAALQAGIDKDYIDPDMSLKDALIRIGEGALIGTMAGAGMSGTLRTAEAGANKLSGGEEGRRSRALAGEIERGTEGEFVDNLDAVATRTMEPEQGLVDSGGFGTDVMQGRSPEQFNADADQGSQLDGRVTETAAEAPEGPLSRATQDAARESELEAVKGDRVTVRTQTGVINGIVSDYTEDGQGNYDARIMDTETGELYQFTQDDPVEINRVMNARQGGAGREEEEQLAPADMTTTELMEELESLDLTVDPNKPVEQARAEQERAQALQQEMSSRGFNDDGSRRVEDPAEMTMPQLRDRLKQLTQQGRQQGWTPKLLEERKKTEALIDQMNEEGGQDADLDAQLAAQADQQAGIDLEEQQAMYAMPDEPPVSGERRQDLQTRRRVADMTPEEMQAALLQDDLTGLGNRRAYEENPRKPVQVSVDADSLKWVNDNMSHGAGDEMLRAIGRAFQKVNADAYHPSGDEFWMQAETQEEADAIMQQVSDELAGAIIEFELPSGEVITKRGIGLSYGTAETIEAAEPRLQAQKAERERTGQRAGRGETPPGVTRTGSNAGVSEDTAEGNQDSQGDTAERSELTAKQQKARDRIAEGRAWFGTEEKAQDFLAKNELEAEFTVQQNGKRFEIQPLAEEAQTNEEGQREGQGLRQVDQPQQEVPATPAFRAAQSRVDNANQEPAGQGKTAKTQAARDSITRSKDLTDEQKSALLAQLPPEGRQLKSNGTPFPTETKANAAMNNRRLEGYQVVPVEGGFALDPVQETEGATEEASTQEAATEAGWTEQYRKEAERAGLRVGKYGFGATFKNQAGETISASITRNPESRIRTGAKPFKASVVTQRGSITSPAAIVETDTFQDALMSLEDRNAVPAQQVIQEPQDTGLVGEKSPQAIASMKAARDNPNVKKIKADDRNSFPVSEKPEWTELDNGFKIRQYVIDGPRGEKVVQEVMSPNGNLAGRTLDGNDNPSGYIDGTLDELLSGAASGSFSDFFRQAAQPAQQKAGIEQQPKTRDQRKEEVRRKNIARTEKALGDVQETELVRRIGPDGKRATYEVADIDDKGVATLTNQRGGATRMMSANEIIADKREGAKYEKVEETEEQYMARQEKISNQDAENDPDRFEPEEAFDYQVDPANFPAPDKTVNYETMLGKDFISQEEANQRIAEWKQTAKDVGEQADNSNKVIISLFDASGEISKPWRDAGFDVRQYDIKLGDDILESAPIAEVQEMIAEGKQVVGVISQPPCTCFTSTSAWAWETRYSKDDRAMVNKMFGPDAAKWFSRPLDYTKALVAISDAIVGEAKAAGTLKFHMLENPVGRIAKTMGMPDPVIRFQPHNFGNDYTKRTNYWGEFNGDLPTANVDPVQGSLIHKLWSSAEKNGGMRSLTPEGPAYAFFMANYQDAMGAQATDGTQAQQERDVKAELEAVTEEARIEGATEQQIEQAVTNFKGNKWYPTAVEMWRDEITAIRQLMETPPPGESDIAEQSQSQEWGANNTLVTRERAEELRQKLRAKLGQMNSGLDPDILAAGTELAVYHLEAGARKFVQFAKAIAADLGTKPSTLRPYLRSWYNGGRDMMEDNGLSIDGMDDPEAVRQAMQNIEALDNENQPDSAGSEADQAAAQGADEQSGADSKRGSAQADSGDVEAGQPGNVGQTAAGRSGPTVRGDSTAENVDGVRDVSERGTAGDGREGAGTEGLSDAGTGGGQGAGSGRDTGNTGGKSAGSGRGSRGARAGRGKSKPVEAFSVDVSTDEKAYAVFDSLEPGQQILFGDELFTIEDKPVRLGLKVRREADDQGGIYLTHKAFTQEGFEAAMATNEQKWRIPKSPAAPGPGNFHYDNPLEIVGGGQVARFNKNKAAIERYSEIRDTGREVTEEDQQVIAAYTGWGSFGQELFQGTYENPRPQKGWEERSEWLRDNLGKTEWEGVQRSIINAHYTDPPTVMAMWDMVRKMGFEGGRVLEPSMGIGNFFGMMPQELKTRSDLAGIELDPVTGGMAQMLYPDANINVMGYEDSKTPDNFYDLVIGNWPFADVKVPDRKYQKLNPNLHDYFFLKALDQTRPGGLVVGITTHGTMDKKGKTIRNELARKGELMAAFRLPTGAFQEYAGTKVVTDIIVLRKRGEPLGTVPSDAGWLNSVPYVTPSGEEVYVNEYFANNPQLVIGEIDFGSGTTTGRPGLIVNRPDNVAEMLNAIPETLPEDGYKRENVSQRISYVTNHLSDREGSLVRTEDGELGVVRGEYIAKAADIQKYAVKSEKTTKDREAQLDKLIAMRRAYGELVEAERSANDKDATKVRKELKKQYDKFVKDHKRLNDSYGLKYMARIEDPFYPALAALERQTDNGWIPSDILTSSTMRGAKQIDNPSVSESYILARNAHVNPTVKQIAEIAKKPEADVRKELITKGAIFELPNGDIEASDIYLSGNVRKKLREAQQAVAEGQTQLQRNIDALERVKPADIPYFNIEAQMGATWVPKEYYEQFVAEQLGLSSPENIEAAYRAGRWKIKMPVGYNQRSEATTGAGTENYPFTKLVNAAIGNQTVVIKTPKDPIDGSQEVDTKKTQEVNGKISELRRKFSEWVWSDPERRSDLETEYNETRNNYAIPSFDGSFMAMEGMALSLGNGPFDLRNHQQNAIWRALVTRKSLNAHEVGTGKTFTMGGIAVESRRYGLAKKPMILAHNANSKTVANEIQQMYPAAKVLYIDNLAPKQIATRMRQIANDDWDAIVVPHSLISNIGFREETLMEMAQQDIDELMAEAYEAAEEDGVKITDDMLGDPEEVAKELGKLRSPTAKELVKARNNIIANIKAQAQKSSKEGSIPFEELGVDMVLVDEVHEFKKPPIATKMRIKGMNTQSSNRSIALRFMLKYVRGQNSGGNVHTFSGTPITNSMTEAFHQMRYIMEEEMRDAGIDQWDGWFGSFAQEEMDIELNAAGEYEAVTRLSKFINTPELRRMIGQYMDVVFSDDMPEMQPRRTSTGKTLDDPSLTAKERDELMNGRTEKAKDRPYKQVLNTTSDLTEEQQVHFNTIQQWAREFRNMTGKERRDAMRSGDPRSPIVYEGLAAKVSFDARLMNGEALAGMEGQVPDDPTSKASKVIDNLLEIYNSDPRATQAVFSQLGLSKSASRTVTDQAGNKTTRSFKTFSTIHDIVERLVQRGVPREEIAVVTGSTSKDKRAQIAEAMNRSEIRIVFGSTQSLGVGVNMQKNMRAMHHMDAPWMPGDLEQRNGRGQRQGNQWNTVREYRYLTDRIDGRRWQLLVKKQQFIEKFLKADDSVRIIDADGSMDEDSDILESFAEAAGDARILQRAKIEKKINMAQQRERLHTQGVAAARRQAKELAGRIETVSNRVKAFEAANAEQRTTESLKANAGNDFTITIDGETYDDRQAAQTALIDFMVTNMKANTPVREIGQYGDITLAMGQSRFATEPQLYAKYADDLEVETGKPSVSSFEATLRGFNDKLEERRNDIQDYIRSQARAEQVAQEPFQQANELDRLQQQLADIEQDLQDNPIAPPAWLRTGAPVETEILWNGERYTVSGHRWNDEGWYVLVEDAEGGQAQVPYMEAKDSQGFNLYQEREFTPATVVEKEQEQGQQEQDDNQPYVEQPKLKRNITQLKKSVKDRFTKPKNIMKGWKNAPPINVAEKFSDLPQELQDYVRSQGAMGDFTGVYWQGEMYLYAPNIRNVSELQQTILHEGIGHYGVEGFFGSQMEGALQEVFQRFRGTPEAKSVIKRYFTDEKFSASKKEHRVRVGAEMLAHLAESGKHRTLWSRIHSMILDAMRKMGFTVQPSKADLYKILRAAERFVKNGEIAVRGRTDVYFSRKGLAEETELDTSSNEAVTAKRFNPQDYPVDQLIEMVPGLSSAVQSAYESGDMTRAEELDARLDGMYEIIDSAFYDIEEEGLTIGGVDQAGAIPTEALRAVMEQGNAEDSESAIEDEVIKIYSNFLSPSHYVDREDMIDQVRGVLDEFAGKQKGLKKVTDDEIATMAKEVYQDWKTRTTRRKPAASGPFLSRKPNVDDMTPSEREQASRRVLAMAEKALAEKDDVQVASGKVVGDMSAAANFLIHPRQVATLHKQFTPAYITAVNQFEMRDSIIDQLYARYNPYMILPKDSKEQVNRLLELGRIVGQTYDYKAVTGEGIPVPSYIDRVITTEQGEYYIAEEPIQLELSEPGDVIKLSPEEAQAYDQMRIMFDEALDLFKNQMLREFGLDQYVGSEDAAAEIMAEIDANPMMATKEIERLLQIAKTIEEIEQAKRRGYVPLSRHGDYVITVKEKPEGMKVENYNGNKLISNINPAYEPALEALGGVQTGEGEWRLTPQQYADFMDDAERVVYSTKIETGLRDAFSIRRLGKNDGDVSEIPSVKKAIAEINKKYVAGNSDRRIIAFAPSKIDPEDVSLQEIDNLANLAGVDNEQWEVIRDQMENEIKGRSFRKHFFRSDNTPGYSTDFERNISQYISGMGGYLARRHYAKSWDDVIAKIRGPRIHKYANDYRDYVNNPTEEFAMLRQVGFLSYIAGNFSTAVVNTTQVPVMTMPALKMISSHATAAKEVARAYKDALKMFRVNRKTGLQIFDVDAAPKDVYLPLKEAWAEGAFVPLETYEVMATARTRGVGQRQLRRKFERSIQAIAYTFTAAERLNRLVTFIAAARIAKNPKYQDKIQRVLKDNQLAQATLFSGDGLTPKKFGEFIIDETQYRMGKVNRPRITRGIGSAIMQFKSFMLQSLEAWYRWMTVQGPEGKMAAASSLAMMVALGGLWGFPGGEELRGLFEAIYRKLTKEDKDLETDMRIWIAETSGQNWLAEFATKGIGYPAGVDLSRIGMGDIIPDTPMDVFGIPADLFIGRPTRAFEKASQGQPVMAAAEFMPNFIKNPMQAYSWGRDGVRDGSGRMILLPEQVTPGMIAKKSIGFQPAAITSVRDYEYAQYRAETAIYQKKTRYLNSLAKAIAQAEMTKDPEQKLELEKQIENIFMEIEEHNQKAESESRLIQISDRALNNRIMREMEGVQSTYGRERTAARSEAEKMREVFGINEILSPEKEGSEE